MPTSELLEPTADVSAVQLVPEDALYEVVNGQRVEKPPMSILAIRLGFLIAYYLEVFLTTNKLGVAVTEAIFLLDATRNLQRRPDAAYVSYARWPASQLLPDTDPWRIVPNMATEVISPSNIAADVNDKIWEYLRAGVELVWVIYPRQQQIYVYESPDRVRLVLPNGELDGGSVLPGFRLPLATLFGSLTPST